MAALSRLGSVDDTLMIGEGIETCLAAMQATGRPAWAALSTSGLRSLELPDDVGEIIILADGDEPGEAAANYAARRWQRAGRRVRIARPPAGMDFNDLLIADAATRPDGTPMSADAARAEARVAAAIEHAVEPDPQDRRRRRQAKAVCRERPRLTAPSRP